MSSPARRGWSQHTGRTAQARRENDGHGTIRNRCWRPTLPAAVDRAGVDSTLPERQLEDALCAAIADRRGYRGDWWVGDDGLWHVELLSPFRNTFGGTTLAQALGWCLVAVTGWAGEIGVRAFA